MFKNNTKQKPSDEKRTLDQLRKQLRSLEPSLLAEIKGGKGAKKVPTALKSCGGWLPQ